MFSHSPLAAINDQHETEALEQHPQTNTDGSSSLPIVHRVPSEPTEFHTKNVSSSAVKRAPGTATKAPAAYDQPPGTPSMIDAIRRYDFVKRALEE